VNLFITNLGFGEPVYTLRGGRRQPQLIGGHSATNANFFIDASDVSFSRIGCRTVWAWPFPEVCTVGEEMHILGDSDVRMSTAPDLWNVILTGMVAVVPRHWWRSTTFSKAVAGVSWPMVALTDRFVGETHGIRVDVTGVSGAAAVAVQGHDSFRMCVGQSCAEFVMHLLRQRTLGAGEGGVYLPEQLFKDGEQRQGALKRMATLPGTFTFRIECPTPQPASVQ
jgi:hypothetical protein